MKKKFLFSVLLVGLCTLMYAQEMSEKKSEKFISPTLGFGAPGVITGFDYMYRHRSGFTAYCNLNLSIPTAPKAGIAVHPEFYVGYSIKHNNLYISFVSGLWGGGGIAAYGHHLRRNVHGKEEVQLEYYGMGLVAFGVRNDYMYFFNEKTGFSFSHTHGFGLHIGRWFFDDTLSFYTMMLKLGVAFRI